MLDEDLALFPELGLDLVLAGAGEVGRALADAAEGEGVALGRDLLGVVGRGLVDGGAGELLARVVAAVLQLVVARVEGERLHHVGPGAQELAVQLQDWIPNHIAVFQCKWDLRPATVLVRYLFAHSLQNFAYLQAYWPVIAIHQLIVQDDSVEFNTGIG